MNESSARRFKVKLACTVLDRLLGLLRKKLCCDGEVLLIAPCNSVHSFGMKEPIDIAFVDRHGMVMKSIEGLNPARVSSCKGAACVLERRLPVNGDACGWLKVGDSIGLLNDRS